MRVGRRRPGRPAAWLGDLDQVTAVWAGSTYHSTFIRKYANDSESEVSDWKTERAHKECAGGGCWVMHVARSIRRRDRTLSFEASRCGRLRLCSHLEAVRHRQVTAWRGTDAKSRQDEVRQRAHACVQSFAGTHADGSMDDRLHRLRHGADPIRPNSVGVGGE